jgi:plasmid stabilization system protein ParE
VEKIGDEGIEREDQMIKKFLTYIRKGYRVYHVGRHLIFYRQKSPGIEIIRILHDRMDVETHLKRG